MKLIAGVNPEVGKIFTEKHVRLHASPDDGTRILEMRYWARGVRRDHIHEWIRDLAPSRALLKWCWTRQGELDPDIYANTWKGRYREEMEQRADLIEGLRARLRNGETLTLLCVCHRPDDCHRRELAKIIREPDSPA